MRTGRASHRLPDATAARALAQGQVLPTITLPATRRLPPDTVQVVRPAFYPGLSFTSLVPAGGRSFTTQVSGLLPVDHAIEDGHPDRSALRSWGNRPGWADHKPPHT